ncbi:MAG: glycosyltransferase [Candidatus Eisenbacteria bacterium]|nr:glycosyltransferase [Candidatus Eisenbacteria bacterium]
MIVDVGPARAEWLRAIREAAGEDAFGQLENLARSLRGHRLAMVNSTATGGGVAEILHRLVRLLNGLGVDTRWHVLPGDERYYRITKAIHNGLHGAPAVITDDDWRHFLEVASAGAAGLGLDADLVLIHDPQPAALVQMLRRPGQPWVWRCHIDLSAADRLVWQRLAPYVAAYDATIFSHAAFVPPLPIPAYLVPPSIDPLSDKNRELDEAEQERLLAPFGLPDDVPLVTQVSRFDRLKDPIGVLEAFDLVSREESAHLVLAGGAADDDPEGREVLAEVRARAGDRRDVTLLDLPPDAHLVINALQRRSAVVVQKSLREGFALTVAEALWKRRAVVAGAVGGIPLQVLHERTGLLVRSVPGCAYQITRLLRSPELRRRLALAGREHVRRHFLLPREACDYLAVFASLATAART